MKRLLFWCLPSSALRFDRAHPMTRPWPSLDLWCRANPALLVRLDPLHVLGSSPAAGLGEDR